MTLPNKIPDKSVLQEVKQKLTSGAGSSKNKIAASIRNGDVTLSGSIQYEHHRRNILRIITSIRGVRRVIDQLKVIPHKKSWEK